ncbi:hypothetical protein ESCO_005370 [Escovopsis weberi]|uniref:Uncharacterized protein n=1 Tax=Escovopsis weberi TaxID=150374 RepID=A0A0M9VUX1_ESCWE|nr:hypothetical protein ESCO_005370 [Escovopsis weberi]
MALVCAMGVDAKGFTVHADLTNHSDFAGKAELMKCLVSWMAFETIEIPEIGLDECERPSKRGKI